MKRAYSAPTNENLVSGCRVTVFSRWRPLYDEKLRNTFPLDHVKLTFMIVIIIMILMSLVGTKAKHV